MPDPTPTVIPGVDPAAGPQASSTATAPAPPPAPPTPPKREPLTGGVAGPQFEGPPLPGDKPAPTGGSEHLRDLQNKIADEREFLSKLYWECEGARIADGDTRRLNLVVQALIGRVCKSMGGVLPKPEPPKPGAK